VRTRKAHLASAGNLRKLAKKAPKHRRKALLQAATLNNQLAAAQSNGLLPAGTDQPANYNQPKSPLSSPAPKVLLADPGNVGKLFLR
jgi:hypothetical protein